MNNTEIFYHGSCHLFDKFSSAFLGAGEGKSKFGHGIYITSSYKTAALYASKAAKANGKECCYVYTVEVPMLTEDNHIFSCKPVNADVIQRTEKAIGEAESADLDHFIEWIFSNDKQIEASTDYNKR